MKLKILSPVDTVYDGEVAHATFPGAAGSFAVYPAHAPLFSTLRKGELICYPLPEGAPRSFPLQSGFVEVKDDRITACIEPLNESND